MDPDDSAAAPYNVLRSAAITFELRREVLGHPMVTFGCRCAAAFEVTVMVRDEEQAAAAMREHLVDDHHVPYAGRCSECRAVTDYFRAHVPDLETDVWLCERHAPAIPVIVDQAQEDQCER